MYIKGNELDSSVRTFPTSRLRQRSGYCRFTFSSRRKTVTQHWNIQITALIKHLAHKYYEAISARPTKRCTSEGTCPRFDILIPTLMQIGEIYIYSYMTYLRFACLASRTNNIRANIRRKGVKFFG